MVVLNNTSLELLEMFSYFICRKHKVVYFNLFFNPFQPNDEKDLLNVNKNHTVFFSKYYKGGR